MVLILVLDALVSINIGNRTKFLFVLIINQLGDNTIIASTRTRYRHQILDGTKEYSYHPAEILYAALS